MVSCHFPAGRTRCSLLDLKHAFVRHGADWEEMHQYIRQVGNIPGGLQVSCMMVIRVYSLQVPSFPVEFPKPAFHLLINGAPALLTDDADDEMSSGKIMYVPSYFSRLHCRFSALPKTSQAFLCRSASDLGFLPPEEPMEVVQETEKHDAKQSASLEMKRVPNAKQKTSAKLKQKKKKKEKRKEVVRSLAKKEKKIKKQKKHKKEKKEKAAKKERITEER